MTPGYPQYPLPALPPLPESAEFSPFDSLSYPTPPVDDGMTTIPVLPGLPVLSETDVLPENPAVDSNKAGLSTDEPEGITEDKKPCTFKLPLSVVLSITEVVNQQKLVNPDATFHKYGVEVLSGHAQYHQAAAERDQYRTRYHDSLTKLAEAAELLTQEKYTSEGLAAQLQDVREFVRRHDIKPDSTPPVARPAEPVPTAPTPAVQDQYIRLQTEIETLSKENDEYLDALESYQPFLNNIGAALSSLYAEASAQSWSTPDYFRQFFEEQIAPFLPTEKS